MKLSIKHKQMKFKIYLSLVLVFACCCIAVAQGPPPFDPTVDDTTVAPIPGIIVGILVALGIGSYKAFKRK
ncbi:MAG: hypothetical protein WBG46_02750 [Nonlabens sp.]